MTFFIVLHLFRCKLSYAIFPSTQCFRAPLRPHGVWPRVIIGWEDFSYLEHQLLITVCLSGMHSFECILNSMCFFKFDFFSLEALLWWPQKPTSECRNQLPIAPLDAGYPGLFRSFANSNVAKLDLLTPQIRDKYCRLKFRSDESKNYIVGQRLHLIIDPE